MGLRSSDTLAWGTQPGAKKTLQAASPTMGPSLNPQKVQNHSHSATDTWHIKYSNVVSMTSSQSIHPSIIPVPLEGMLNFKIQHVFDSHLVNTIGPALTDAVLCPGVVCILSKFVHDGFLS